MVFNLYKKNIPLRQINKMCVIHLWIFVKLSYFFVVEISYITNHVTIICKKMYYHHYLPLFESFIKVCKNYHSTTLVNPGIWYTMWWWGCK